MGRREERKRGARSYTGRCQDGCKERDTEQSRYGNGQGQPREGQERERPATTHTQRVSGRKHRPDSKAEGGVRGGKAGRRKEPAAIQGRCVGGSMAAGSGKVSL